MATRIPPTTGVILAGGQGARMEGRDKGLEPFRGRPLAAHALEALRPQVVSVLISANRHLRRYAALRAPVVTDPVPTYQGPLAGMLAGLRNVQTEWVLFVPCDTVWLPPGLAVRLHAALEAGGSAAYATTAGDGVYTCCLLNCALADAVENALSGEQRSVREFLADCEAVAVDFPGWPAAARNINTPADLRRAAHWAGARS